MADKDDLLGSEDKPKTNILLKIFKNLFNLKYFRNIYSFFSLTVLLYAYSPQSRPCETEALYSLLAIVWLQLRTKWTIQS